MGIIKYFSFFLILFLLLSSCAEESQTTSNNIDTPKSKVESKIKSTFKINTNSEYEIKSLPGGLSVDISYTPFNVFKYKSEATDKRAFETSTYAYLRNVFIATPQIQYITLKAVEKSQKLVANPTGQLHILSQNNESITREIARINISKEEFDQLQELYEDPQFKIVDYMEYHPFFQVEIKLKTEKTDIKNIIVGELVNNKTEDSLTEIRYEPKNVKTLGNMKNDKIEFEENFANIIRFSFEADESIDKIRLIAQTDYVDNRSGTSKSTIASYEATREEFETIMDNWDNYRYKIYEQMNYTDIFLLDLVSTSKITKLEFGSSAIIDAFYDENFKTIINTVDTLEKDAVEIIYNLIDYYDEVDSMTVNFKTKLPAEVDDESADGVHKIIHDALIISVSRGQAKTVNIEKLTNKQILYNFGPTWSYEVFKKNIIGNIDKNIFRGFGVDIENIRSITMPSSDEIVIDLNSCDIENEYNKKQLGGGDICGEECVYEKIVRLANRTMYDIHPPYIESLTIKLTKVTLDQAGNEDTEEFGEIIFEKDPNTNYWFQTEEDIEWFDVEDDLDIDGDNICQI